MAGDIPPQIAGYWGPITEAASLRLGVAGAFGAVNEARASAGLGPLSGVDAIQMGQLYSLAVQQRNAGEAMLALNNQVAQSSPDQAAALRDTAITSNIITQTISSRSPVDQAIMPNFKVQYQVVEATPEGPVASFRWINLGNEVPQTLGTVMDLVNSTNDLIQEEHGVQISPTGYVNIFQE